MPSLPRALTVCRVPGALRLHWTIFKASVGLLGVDSSESFEERKLSKPANVFSTMSRSLMIILNVAQGGCNYSGFLKGDKDKKSKKKGGEKQTSDQVNSSSLDWITSEKISSGCEDLQLLALVIDKVLIIIFLTFLVFYAAFV